VRRSESPVVLMDEIARYEVRRDIMYIQWSSLQIAIPMDMLLGSMLACEEAIAKWRIAQSGSGDVIQLTSRKR
jgi:hypothetical protein